MKSTNRLPDALLGVGYLAVAAALVVVALLAYNKTFVDRVDIKLETSSLGNALQKNSDVKLNGVPVGTVTNIETSDGGAVLTLGLNPSTAAKLPTGTTARLLPKTLFGERFVSLIPGDGGQMLAGGDTIRQDLSSESVELEQVFDELLPLLQSIQPDKLSASLGELATMLRGQGRSIGDSLEAWSAYLTKLNPKVPTMTDDLQKLASVARTYDEAVPDLLAALDTFTKTTATVVDQRTQLVDVYASVIGSSNTTRGWVDKNQNTIEVLAEESRAALEAAVPYARQFPCLLDATSRFVPVMDKTLGKGTNEPGIHVQLNVVEARGKYLPGKDTPKFNGKGKARCPYVTGRTGAQLASATTDTSVAAESESEDEPELETIAAPPAPSFASRTSAAVGIGDANSPAENQLIAELIAPTRGLAPDEYPDWASLLVGPTLRNTKVTLR